MGKLDRHDDETRHALDAIRKRLKPYEVAARAAVYQVNVRCTDLYRACHRGAYTSECSDCG